MTGDDDTVSLVSFSLNCEIETGEHEEVEEHAAFREQIEAAQRLALLRNQGEYTYGRTETSTVVRRELTPEKMFHVPRLYSWDEGEPEDLLQDLATKRVRARLQARMGLGKSTRLAPLIAQRLDKRVLLVSLDAVALRQASEYTRATGIGRFKRYWPRGPGNHLCCMTYADFCGHMISNRRADLYKAFDVIVMDEAFEATWAVWCAKRSFAVYASADVNLVLCSATISTEEQNGGGESASSGTFRDIPTSLSFEDMMVSGKLLGDYLADRSYVVLPTDTEVDQAEDYYREAGVPTVRLDSAGTDEDLMDAVGELRGDSVTPRVVIMHHRWAIMFNFELEFGIIRPCRGYIAEVDGVWRELQEPMSEAMVTQAKSRTGRGIGESSGGIVVGVERMEPVELYESDVEKAFFCLHAMHIKPNKSGRWQRCYARYPDGVPASVAYLAMKVNLPPAVTMKFVAEDGLIAAKYARAVSMITQIDHYIIPSDHDEPKAKAEWVLDDWVDEGLQIESRRVVPVHAEGELQVLLHGLVAMAEGELELTRWRPQSRTPIGDYESDDGIAGSTLRRLRRPERRALPQIATTEVVYVDPGLRFDGMTVGGEGRRHARVMDKERLREALVAMEHALRTGTTEPAPVVPVETEEGSVAQLEMGMVNSPGGTLVCELPMRTCETMNEGRVLSTSQFMSLLRRVKGIEGPFVASRFFDSFAGPWESFLRSLVDGNTLAMVKKRGEWTLAFDLVEKLRQRFDIEMVNVLAQSNLTRTLVERIFRKAIPKASVLMKAIDKGSFDRYTHSRRFFDRVKLLRMLLDRALVDAESVGVFLPNMISDAQRAIAYGTQPIVGRAKRIAAGPSDSFGSELVEQMRQRDRLKKRLSGEGRKKIEF